jgi:hypothetical protein
LTILLRPLSRQSRQTLGEEAIKLTGATITL